MAIYAFHNVTQDKLQQGLNKLRSSGMTVDGNKVSGMGVEATYTTNASTLTVNVTKAPPFMGGMVEGQLKQFFS